ncbi:MAG: pentapeptide repeat-containing protein [Leptolyngbyaceae cyanobacterium RU_5_1]|nr:pentapeptide repeat-containing protein [Leptolyngbyaceae cyanobacterium RU_5_1]
MNNPIISLLITCILFIGILSIELLGTPSNSGNRNQGLIASPPQAAELSKQAACKGTGDFWKDELPCQMKESKWLSQVQNFAIVFGAILFLLEGRQRKQQIKLEAWRTIDTAQGQETSGARIQALEELANNKDSLAGLDANGADLIGINLPETELLRANLNQSKLQVANLKSANLNQSNMIFAALHGACLSRAKLEGANLTLARLSPVDVKTWKLYTRKSKIELIKRNILNIIGHGNDSGTSYDEPRKTCLESANLWDAKLLATDLKSVNLRKAKLHGADLRYANLKYADLSGADLENADLRYANLEKIKISEETNLKYTDLRFSRNLNRKELEGSRNFNTSILEDTSSEINPWTKNASNSNSSKADQYLEEYILKKIQEFQKIALSEDHPTSEKAVLIRIANELIQSFQVWSMLNLIGEDADEARHILLSFEENMSDLEKKAEDYFRSQKSRNDLEKTGDWLNARAEKFGKYLSDQFDSCDRYEGIVICLQTIGNNIRNSEEPQKSKIQGDFPDSDFLANVLMHLQIEYLPHIFANEHTDQAIVTLLPSAIQESIQLLQQDSPIVGAPLED